MKANQRRFPAFDGSRQFTGTIVVAKPSITITTHSFDLADIYNKKAEFIPYLLLTEYAGNHRQKIKKL